MTVLSLLRGRSNNFAQFFIQKSQSSKNFSTARALCMPLGEDWKVPNQSRFVITPGRWQWQKTKDHLHFYFLLGIIPACITVFLANVFIGPATLEEIPEGYVPKQYEYFKHPISRFISYYVTRPMQQDYERNLFYQLEEDEKRRMRLLTWKVERLMKERGDYAGIVWQPTRAGRYIRKLKEDDVDVEDSLGRRY